MKASDLLNADVVDESGRRLGKVHDIRLARSPAMSRWQLQAVVVGPSGLAHRFGYATGDVRGPALLTAIAHRLARRRQFIAWSQVLSYGDGRIVVHSRPGSEQP